jgi:hypothetical protein
MPNDKLKLDRMLLDWSLAKDSLAEFVKQAWRILEPTTPLQWNWHLHVICEYLEALAAGDGINRLIVNLPPRSGKSILASIMWPAWVWGKAAFDALGVRVLQRESRPQIFNRSPQRHHLGPVSGTLAGPARQRSESEERVHEHRTRTHDGDFGQRRRQRNRQGWRLHCRR